jgi:vancomycin resistance protein YoaR
MTLRFLPVFALAGFGIAAALRFPTAREVCMGRYDTALEGRSPSQRFNARLCLGSLDGAVIQPGETFSFNDRVGTWSRDAGYRKAPVSFNGQLVLSWGGGVCQTSTTLYNAALLSGMEIIERHPHFHAATYAPPGRDAAVAYSGIDLRFKNPYPFPVRVSAEWTGSKLSVAIWGAKTRSPAPEIVTELREVFHPATVMIQGESSSRLRNSGKSGFEVATYRIIGNRKELLSVDSYPVMQRIVESP